jgi:CBS domain-containing protein
MTVDSDLKQFLLDAAGRERPNLIEVPIRELLARWGHKRRGTWVVDGIERDLKKAGLATEPDFTQGWIDAVVTLVPKRLMKSPNPSADRMPAATEAQDGIPVPGEVTLIIGSLKSASQPVCSVALDSTLLQAQSLMMKNDFSQLAVMSDLRSLRGAVTWESIAQTSMRMAKPQVRDCVIQAELVRFEDDLIQHIPQIVRSGYVFVQRHDRTISGIVTTADLSEEFGRRATPFFLIGEIERRLRRAVDRIFSQSELNEVRDPRDATRDVESASDLTIGEYIRLLESPPRWSKTGWQAERSIFIDALHAVREIRNDVLHFSPDPLDEDQIDSLRGFIRWLRFLDPDR